MIAPLKAAGTRVALSIGLSIGLNLALCMAPAFAGQACTDHPITRTALENALTTSANVQAALNASGGEVAIVGRQGNDLSEYGLKYTHAGFVFRAAPDQPWRVYELLNQCGTADSELWVDGLANFFLDDPFTFDAVLIVPPPAVAARLARLLGQPAQLHHFHERQYNMVAYPFSTRYQNSNQWLLELLAAAEASDVRVRDREQAQAWLKLVGYRPTEMHIGPLTRLGGRMFKANVAFDDHPNQLRFSDRINVVTVESIMAFVRQRDEGWTILELKSGH
ncbi:DUF2145 domain-containing protein [Rugamonas sp.]|uniref:DUF2145 domain-containing protein n=1 Tax=Rugamonas sp. TaxID=1926287 RepID=UPI0025CFCCF5|nr:DUF2145 domain-containing protein [Rugamonas sp.]